MCFFEPIPQSSCHGLTWNITGLTLLTPALPSLTPRPKKPPSQSMAASTTRNWRPPTSAQWLPVRSRLNPSQATSYLSISQSWPLTSTASIASTCPTVSMTSARVSRSLQNSRRSRNTTAATALLSTWAFLWHLPQASSSLSLKKQALLSVKGMTCLLQWNFTALTRVRTLPVNSALSLTSRLHSGWTSLSVSLTYTC